MLLDSRQIVNSAIVGTDAGRINIGSARARCAPLFGYAAGVNMMQAIADFFEVHFASMSRVGSAEGNV